MPELPEVETVRSGLETLICGAEIARVELLRPDLRAPIPVQLPRRLRGQKIEGVRRRAKFLLIETPRWTLLSHLGMTGSWRVAAPGDERPHDHCYLHLGDGRRLAFRDPRRFGVMDLIPRGREAESRWLASLGPEPLDPNAFTAETLWQKARGRDVAIKNFIMDQKIVVGVGNIYASEALFRAGLRPKRSARSISKAAMSGLVEAIRAVLSEAIAAHGTTLKDYRQTDGDEGLFQNQLAVYDRAGEPCRVCRSPLRAAVVGGRSTFWCGQCQR